MGAGSGWGIGIGGKNSQPPPFGSQPCHFLSLFLPFALLYSPPPSCHAPLILPLKTLSRSLFTSPISLLRSCHAAISPFLSPSTSRLTRHFSLFSLITHCNQWPVRVSPVRIRVSLKLCFPILPPSFFVSLRMFQVASFYESLEGTRHEISPVLPILTPSQPPSPTPLSLLPSLRPKNQYFSGS